MSAAIPQDLAGAYLHCRSILRQSSTGYAWATRLLAAGRRPHVHALYAFARTADDIVDLPGRDPVAALTAWRARFDAAVAAGRSDDPVLAAVCHTIATFELPSATFDRFFDSMAMDLTVTSYETWDDLLAYMDGSAAAIGELMVPLLDAVDPLAAMGPARDLGLAFQLTNFLRDIREDLDRGRQYIPQEDLRRFHVDLTDRTMSPGFAELVRFESDRCRALYRSADAGLALLPRGARRSIAVAQQLYERVLDQIAHNGFDVWSTRARLPMPKKVFVTAMAALRN